MLEKSGKIKPCLSWHGISLSAKEEVSQQLNNVPELVHFVAVVGGSCNYYSTSESRDETGYLFMENLSLYFSGKHCTPTCYLVISAIGSLDKS